MATVFILEKDKSEAEIVLYFRDFPKGQNFV